MPALRHSSETMKKHEKLVRRWSPGAGIERSAEDPLRWERDTACIEANRLRTQGGERLIGWRTILARLQNGDTIDRGLYEVTKLRDAVGRAEGTRP